MQGRQRNLRILLKLSHEVYRIASQQYNEDKPNRELLKDAHYWLFDTLLNALDRRLKENPLSTERLWLPMASTELAKIYRRHPNTMRARLKRLEEAGIIKVKFRGYRVVNDKKIYKPLGITFNKNIILFYDMMDKNFATNSIFLETSKSDIYNSFNKKAESIKDTEVIRTDINIKITDKETKNKKIKTYKNKIISSYKNKNISSYRIINAPPANIEFAPEKQMLSENKNKTCGNLEQSQNTENQTYSEKTHMVKFNMLSPDKQRLAQEFATEIQKHENISFDEALQKALVGVKIDKKISQKKNKSSAEIGEFEWTELETLEVQSFENVEIAIKSKILNYELQKKKNTSDIIARIKNNLGNKKKLDKAEVRRAKMRQTYVAMFVDYLIDNLFEDKKIQFTTDYYNEIIDYVNKNYFSNCNTIKALEYRWFTYQYRIDVAKKYLNKYIEKNNFDTTYLYPLAYLNIYKKGAGQFSFMNTESFSRNGKDWKRKNGYNRNLTPELRKKLNKYARNVEMGKDTYDNALENLKNLTKDNTELVNQFNLRMKKHFIVIKENKI